MPQLSPMSWVMVIVVFVMFFIFFSVAMWWMIEGKYFIDYAGGVKDSLGKKPMKSGFGGGLVK
uniref:ATP synthase F0 subunit 8 n=1 Tax=Sinanodonta woodiana TaxID=1069815 RepID=A0A0U1V6D2_SINWO|nr:ATP synthase F0 subunit 8 [Sinanodonta woodiana]AIN80929.1 ATP synthase F0 subunit 8 [Sinanodonta woodiana]